MQLSPHAQMCPTTLKDRQRRVHVRHCLVLLRNLFLSSRWFPELLEVRCEECSPYHGGCRWMRMRKFNGTVGARMRQPRNDVGEYTCMAFEAQVTSQHAAVDANQ